MGVETVETQHLIVLEEGKNRLSKFDLPQVESRRAVELHFLRVFTYLEHMSEGDAFEVQARIFRNEPEAFDLSSLSAKVSFEDIKSNKWMGWIAMEFESKLIYEGSNYRVDLNLSKFGDFDVAVCADTNKTINAIPSSQTIEQTPRIELYLGSVE